MTTLEQIRKRQGNPRKINALGAQDMTDIRWLLERINTIESIGRSKDTQIRLLREEIKRLTPARMAE